MLTKNILYVMDFQVVIREVKRFIFEYWYIVRLLHLYTHPPNVMTIVFSHENVVLFRKRYHNVA